MSEDRNIWKNRRFTSWFSHPLILLIAGAIISSLIFPTIVSDLTNQWQENEKQLEIKSDLVEEINTSVTSVITAIGFLLDETYMPPDLRRQELAIDYYTNNFLQTYSNWQNSKESIGSKIDLYFPNDQIVKDWGELSYVVSGLWLLSKIPDIPAANVYSLDYQSPDFQKAFEIFKKNEMCKRLGVILEIQSIYGDAPFDVGTGISVEYECNELNYSIPKYIERNERDLQNNGNDINWAVLFKGPTSPLFSSQPQNITSMAMEQQEFIRSFSELKNRVIQHMDNVLTTISRSECCF